MRIRLLSLQKARPRNSALGFSIVEVLLASSLFALFVTGFAGVYLYGQEGSATSGNRARALLLAQEGLDAVQNISESGFGNLTVGTFGLSKTTNQWVLTGSFDTTGLFRRQTVITSFDADRKDIAVTVTWTQNAQRTGSITLNERLTNWQKAAGTFGNWANPNVLTSSVNLAGTGTGMRVILSGGYAYVIRSAGTPNVAILDTTQPGPPVVVGSLTLPGTPKGIALSGTTLYVATTDDTHELQVINVSTPAAPTLIGSYDAPSTADGLSVAVVGNTLYLGRALSSSPELVALNVTTPATPTLLGTYKVTGAVNSIAPIGTATAVLATASSTRDLLTVDITTPAAMKMHGGVDLANTAQVVKMTGNTAAIGTASSLFLYNLTNVITPTLLGGYSVGGVVNDLVIASNYIFVANSATANELMVIDMSVPATPSVVGTFNASAAFQGVDYDANTDRAYIVGAATAAEVSVVGP